MSIRNNPMSPTHAKWLSDLRNASSGKSAPWSSLAMVGAMRHFSELPLVELVAKHGSDTRRYFEDAKPYADILRILGPDLIPSIPFSQIPRADARQLANLLLSMDSGSRDLATLKVYLKTTCKFRENWVSFVVSKFAPSDVWAKKRTQLTIPTTYQRWLEMLESHLDSIDSIISLIQYLADKLSVPTAEAKVLYSQVINGHQSASIQVFFIITNWLSERPSTLSERPSSATN